jgi:hypothetical protein
MRTNNKYTLNFFSFYYFVLFIIHVIHFTFHTCPSFLVLLPPDFPYSSYYANKLFLGHSF